MKNQIFVTFLLLTSGCASSPFAQNWDWNSRPDTNWTNNSFEEDRKRVLREMKKTEKLHPSWKKATLDGESYGEIYDENGRKISTFRVKH